MTRRIRAVPAADVVTSVITVQEVLTGWYALLRQVTRPHDVERVFGRLASAVTALGGLRIVNYTQPAIARFGHLDRLKLNVKKNDLRIAAIALEAGRPSSPGTSGTSGGCRGLAVEDWSQPAGP